MHNGPRNGIYFEINWMIRIVIVLFLIFRNHGRPLNINLNNMYLNNLYEMFKD